jgi:ABC-type transport system substrate-binding protein
MDMVCEKNNDKVFDFDKDAIETYIDDPRMREASSTTVFHIDVNCQNPENPLTANLNYRKALYHAMNREVIASIFGYQQPSGVYVNGQAGMFSGEIYRESEAGKSVTDLVETWGPWGYNPELAKEYLAKAYEECGLSDDTVITLIYAIGSTETTWLKTGEYLQEEFPKIFDGKINLEIKDYGAISATQFKASTDVWDMSPNDWSRGASRTYPYTCFYYYLESYGSHPNNYFDAEFEAQYAVCESVKDDYEAMLKETQKLEEIYIDKVIHIPMVQAVSYQMFSDRLVLPVTTYIPGFGWGTMFGDIAE